MNGITLDRDDHSKTVNWTTIDWSLYDAQIAKKVGRTRQRVGQVRAKLGLSPSPNKNMAIDLAMKDFVERSAVFHAQSPKDVQVFLQMPPVKAQRIWNKHCKDLGKPQYKDLPEYKLQIRKRYKNPWHLMNPDLPNADLSRIWGIKEPPSQGVGYKVAIRRLTGKSSTFSGRKAKWDGRCRADMTDPEYHKAYNEEVEKARVYMESESGKT